jgi:hypothetical protein
MAAMDDATADEAFVETVDDGFEHPGSPGDLDNSKASEHGKVKGKRMSAS